jgi:predicted metalloprotease with PDZ domain
MKHNRNLPGRLTFCAITTFVMGAGSQAIAQNQPETQNPSNPPAAVEQRPGGAEAVNRQEGMPRHMGLGMHFETQATSGHGLEIANVDPNSPAEQAGLQAHDRLISIDGRPFKHHRHAKAYLSAQTGRPVPLVIERNGRQLMLQFVPGQPEGDSGWVGILLYGENEMAPNAQVTPAARTNSPDGNQNAQNAAGSQSQSDSSNSAPQGGAATTQGVSPGAPYTGQNAPGQTGARVAQIYPGSPAARAGLQPGDLVTQINGQKIDDPAELVALIHEMKPQTKAEFEVTRDNQTQKMPVTIGSRASEYGEGQFGAGQRQAGPDPNALQRLEDEVHQLREEIRQLREQLQKK